MKKTVVVGNVPQLKILIVKAIGLPAADIGGTSDPYVQIQIGHDYGWNPKVWKTSKLKKNLNPIWNEEFIVPVTSPEKDGVRLAVFDYDFIGSDDLLGQVVFPALHKLPLGVPTEAVLTLTGLNSTRGTLHVVFTALNFGVQGPTVIQTTQQQAPVAVQQTTMAPAPVAVQQTTTAYNPNPYGQQPGYPVQQQAYSPAPAPYGAPAANPYGAAPGAYAVPNMYGAPQQYPQQSYAQPAYGAPAPNPYGAPAANPYGAPAPNPYGAPAPNPYGAPAPNPYGAPPAY